MTSSTPTVTVTKIYAMPRLTTWVWDIEAAHTGGKDKLSDSTLTGV